MGIIKDLTGKKYGMLTVEKRGADRYGKTGRKFITWDCICECGNHITVDAQNLRTGNTQSCGCNKHIIDIAGKRFGDLVALYPSKHGGDKGVFWKCQCKCGQETDVRGSSLRSGATKSCGCGIVNGLKLGWESKTHGCSKTRLYSIWCGMKRRTSKAADERHRKDYYDRGIRTCDEWKNSFEAFQKWSLENGYDDGLTIERIDNNGNYEPGNCKWIPIEMQASNRRSSRILTYNGKSQTMAQWARELNISEDMLRERIVVLHWGVEDALLTPSQTRGWSNEQRQLSRFRDSVWVR